MTGPNFGYVEATGTQSVQKIKYKSKCVKCKKYKLKPTSKLVCDECRQ